MRYGLDLGCGSHKRIGYVGMDVRSLLDVDIVHDVEDIPWPIPDAITERIRCNHLVEHINPAHGGFIRFMDECWRVMVPGGVLYIVTPYAGSYGYWQDPTHINGCNETTWLYFDPQALDEHGDVNRRYRVYKPKPWAVQHVTLHENGIRVNMEVLLTKRSERCQDE